MVGSKILMFQMLLCIDKYASQSTGKSCSEVTQSLGGTELQAEQSPYLLPPYLLEYNHKFEVWRVGKLGLAPEEEICKVNLGLEGEKTEQQRAEAVLGCMKMETVEILFLLLLQSLLS